MPMSCRIDRDRSVIMIRGSGVLTDQEMLDALKELRTSPDLQPNMPTLSDMTGLEGLEITPVGLAKTIELMESTADRRGSAKAAIVVEPDSYAACRYAQLLAEMADSNHVQPRFKVFHHAAEACEWIGLEPA